MNGLLGSNIDKIRRSNRILHKKRFVQYPFENDLSKLPPEDLDYCVNGFLHNPYENYDAQNMLQFFLKTFGEGITNTYLRPYNEKSGNLIPALWIRKWSTVFPNRRKKTFCARLPAKRLTATHISFISPTPNKAVPKP